MDQHQSLLFRLPRELRDEIYSYYLREQGGYIFSLSAQKFRQSNGLPIELALGYTCKRVAAEIHGYALRENTLRFHVLPQTQDTFHRCSTAGSFARLLELQHGCLIMMLRQAYWLISPEAIREMGRKYPGNIAVKRLEQKVAEDGNVFLSSGHLLAEWALDSFVEYVMLQDLIKVISTHPDFVHLTSRVYEADVVRGPLYRYPDEDYDFSLDYPDIDFDDDSSEDSYDRDSPWYTKETQFQIMNWKPALWWIPDEDDLDAVTKFLTMEPSDPTYDDTGREVRPKYYFSAAAAAIQWLERLTSENRMHLRKLIIQEDYTSINLPQTHARGLVLLCVENPQLQVERRVDIWKTEFIPASEHFNRDVRSIVQGVGHWICETKFLRALGMPPASFSLVLHGPTKEASQQLCDAMIKAAIWQEGVEELARRDGKEFRPWWDAIAEDFVDLTKAMIRGDIPARFEADMGEVWDIEEVLRNWSDRERNIFALKNFEEPDGGWEAARAGYFEQVGWVERMDGWDLLVAENQLEENAS